MFIRFALLYLCIFKIEYLLLFFWNTTYFKFKKEKKIKKINITFESKTNNWIIISFCISFYISIEKVTWFWRSLTVCFSIFVLYYDFVCLSLDILFFCLFLVFIVIFQTWISIIYLFFYLFVCFYLIIFWNTKLKSKLFNQEINIYFWIQKIQFELNTWFSKNTIHFLICWMYLVIQ